MPDTSLSSFISSNQYNREVVSVPFVAAMRTGTGYRAPVFNGIQNATSIDPGGLFGWLIYARTNFTPAKGATTDTYILYTNPSDLVQDLNRLGGVTYCHIAPVSGSTYSLFIPKSTTEVSPTTIGLQFLNAISYMAYGGSLVLAGQASGFDKYIQENNTSTIDVVIDPLIDTSLVNWLSNQQYTTGIFASRPDATGVTGAGYTMANFDDVLGAQVSGMTQGIKFFNVYGLKTKSALDVSLLQQNSTITYTIPAVSDVAGFFARTKNRNELYLTVAGLDRSTTLNGDIANPIDWYSTLKSYLRTNKVNFFINNNPKFLGSDLVGATYSTSAITVNDRIGPARLRFAITQAINNIALKHVFSINNQTTRDQVVSEVQTALDPFAPYLDTTQTQIICNSDNNQDNSDTLRIDVVAKPILGTESFVINFTYTA